MDIETNAGTDEGAAVMDTNTLPQLLHGVIRSYVQQALLVLRDVDDRSCCRSLPALAVYQSLLQDFVQKHSQREETEAWGILSQLKVMEQQLHAAKGKVKNLTGS